MNATASTRKPTAIQAKAATYAAPETAAKTIRNAIRRAGQHEIELTAADFGTDEFGEPGLDGMDPTDWLDAMTGE